MATGFAWKVLAGARRDLHVGPSDTAFEIGSTKAGGRRGRRFHIGSREPLRDETLPESNRDIHRGVAGRVKIQHRRFHAYLGRAAPLDTGETESVDTEWG